MFTDGEKTFPTPIISLGEKLNNTLYIKREDLIPFSFGGNKARKAEYFFKEIEKGKYDAVITYGSSSSNHCRVISNMAKSKNLPCFIISPKEASLPTYNSKIINLFGAEVTVVPANQVHNAIENKIKSLREKGLNPYFIMGGGHGNLGTQAYVDCYEEIKNYEVKNRVYFDYIFFASGTGTTQAGLICGQLFHNDQRQIVGISIARKNPRGKAVVINSVNEYLTCKEVNFPVDDISSKTLFVDEYVGDGYASKNSRVESVMIDALKQYGISLDATYTGKAYYGMLDYIDKENIKNKNILFIHTGGTPLFFDFLENL